MELPKIDVDLFKVQEQLEDYFNIFLEKNRLNGYFFKSPSPIVIDDENDQKVFITGFFRNTNGINDTVSSIYFIYYDGCSCPNLKDSPGNRYMVSLLSDVSLVHQWMIYNQCEVESV